MKCSTKVFVTAILCITASIAMAVIPNPVENATNITVSGYRENIGTLFIVGDQTSANNLSITNGGSVINTRGVIGERATSESNTVRVSGNNSLWTSRSKLDVGNLGSFNTLTIENGGRVISTDGVIGVDTISAGNNVTVQGNNSIWDVENLLSIGEAGDGNSLYIYGGARVNSEYAKIGATDSAIGNSVIVSGAGSIWSNSADLIVGHRHNSGNTLTIENGGKVIVSGELDISPLGGTLNLDADGWLKIEGYADLDNFGFNFNPDSTLEVTGSVWFNSDVLDGNTLIFQGENAYWRQYTGGNYLTVGNGLDDNTTIISNGANIKAHTVSIGRTSSSEDNLVYVTGSNSVFLIQTNLYVGYAGSDNELHVSDGASVSVLTGYVGRASTATNNQIIVEGSNSSFTVSAETYLGLNGGVSNRLEVSDGASVSLGRTFLGHENSLGNSILATGSNTSFTAGELHVGEGSTGSVFRVEDGAYAKSSSAFIGSGTNGTSYANVVLVTGSNSVWEAGALKVGSDVVNNNNNTLTIENGGKVIAGSMAINTPTLGNQVYLNQGGWLTIGENFDVNTTGLNWAARSTLEVQGVVSNLNGRLDRESTLVLSGGGIWSNDVEVIVGYTNALNHLKLVDGGTVQTRTNDVVGYASSSVSNTVEISGSGSMWKNTNGFTLGRAGADNTMAISDGGVLSASGLVVGDLAGSDRNKISLDGEGASIEPWYGVLILGYRGASNEITVANGASVNRSSSIIGYQASSIGNTVLIQNEGSIWDNSSDLTIGRSGAGNSVTVSNGGYLSVTRNLYLGEYTGSDSNSLRVIGSDSTAEHIADLYVGHAGAGNTLEILDGASLYNSLGYVGTENGSDGNMVTVDGSNSLWYSRNNLYAGHSGTSNTVYVRNNGLLYNDMGYIGYLSNAMDNAVVVDGAGWTNTLDLYVGHNGSGNSLVITNGARVESRDSFIGAVGSANSNLVFVAGSNSLWRIKRNLLVGSTNNTGNSLVVTNFGSVVVDGDLQIRSGNTIDVDNDGLLSVFGNVDFSGGININNGGTVETHGTVSGLGGVLPSGQTLSLSGYGALWEEPGDIRVENGATLNIGPYAQVIATSNYYQEAGGTLRFGMEFSAGEPAHGTLSVGQIASFESGANFLYATNYGGISFDETYTNTLVTSETLVIAGLTNATTANLRNHLNYAGTLESVSLFATGTNSIIAIINHIGLGYFITDPDLRAIVNEIDERAIFGDPLALRMRNLLTPLSDAQKLKQLTQFYKRGVPTYAHADGILLGLKQINQRTSTMLIDTGYYVQPLGAYGPSASDGTWRGWMSAHGSQLTRDGSTIFSGYDASAYGTLVGVDKTFDNLVVGLAGGQVGSSIDQDDGDTSEATTSYGAIYGTTRVGEVDIDVIGSYGSSSIENKSGTIFGSDAEFDASSMILYIGATEEESYGSMTLTPVLAAQAVSYSQDAYEEVSANAVGRSVDSYDRVSVQSFLGGTIGMMKMYDKFDLLTRISGTWKHEFNADEDRVNFRLINGTDPHFFTIQAPVEDSYDLGISLSALFKEKLEIGVGLNGRMSDEFTEVNYNGNIQYTF